MRIKKVMATSVKFHDADKDSIHKNAEETGFTRKNPKKFPRRQEQRPMDAPGRKKQ